MSNTSLPHRNVDSGWNHHEIIRILTCDGNAMFITCADATAMSAQPVQNVGIEDMFIWGSLRNDHGFGILPNSL